MASLKTVFESGQLALVLLHTRPRRTPRKTETADAVQSPERVRPSASRPRGGGRESEWGERQREPMREPRTGRSARRAALRLPLGSLSPRRPTRKTQETRVGCRLSMGMVSTWTMRCRKEFGISACAGVSSLRRSKATDATYRSRRSLDLTELYNVCALSRLDVSRRCEAEVPRKQEAAKARIDARPITDQSGRIRRSTRVERRAQRSTWRDHQSGRLSQVP